VYNRCINLLKTIIQSS